MLLFADPRFAAKTQIGLAPGAGYPHAPASKIAVKKPPPTAPHILKAPSPLREVIQGNTTK